MLRHIKAFTSFCPRPPAHRTFHAAVTSVDPDGGCSLLTRCRIYHLHCVVAARRSPIALYPLSSKTTATWLSVLSPWQSATTRRPSHNTRPSVQFLRKSHPCSARMCTRSPTTSRCSRQNAAGAPRCRRLAAHSAAIRAVLTRFATACNTSRGFAVPPSHGAQRCHHMARQADATAPQLGEATGNRAAPFACG